MMRISLDLRTVGAKERPDDEAPFYWNGRKAVYACPLNNPKQEGLDLVVTVVRDRNLAIPVTPAYFIKIAIPDISACVL
ncbi:MAG: hypothetical protein A4E57_04271 [Syntrophorhabdaceae bacterium PtaU1.Bin034]|nr:MAG: hypothetical protein A4E57_04271 [Syntrophorhabdaceae bacterium PtaU1.Bin034]